MLIKSGRRGIQEILENPTHHAFKFWQEISSIEILYEKTDWEKLANREGRIYRCPVSQHLVVHDHLFKQQIVFA